MPFDGCPVALDLSPGTGWHGLPEVSGAAWLRLTPDLPPRLRQGSGPVALGAETDPYLSIERGLALTRQVLEALERAGRPVHIVTHSTAVLRDRDILLRLTRRGLVRVCIAVATLDAGLSRRLEPRAAPPALRLATLRALAEAGIPVAVLAAPLIPGLNDLELERILAAGAAAGATHAGCASLALPAEARPAIEAWVRTQLPRHAAQVLTLAREVRAPGWPAGTLADRFQAAIVRFGLNAPQADRPAEGQPCQPELALAAA